MSAVNSQKVQTLPPDLKKIADQLIDKKFGKEKKAKRPNPFPDDIEYSYGYPKRADDPALRYPYGQPGDITFELRPWDRRTIAKSRIHGPSYRKIKEAVMALHRENVNTSNAEMYVAPEAFRDICQDLELRDYVKFVYERPMPGEKDVVAELFGMKVIIHPGIRGAFIEAAC